MSLTETLTEAADLSDATVWTGHNILSSVRGMSPVSEEEQDKEGKIFDGQSLRHVSLE